MSASKKGYVHLYTGNGKGKTTAALGLALRAVGKGFKVLIIQFLKDEEEISGEKAAAARLHPELEIRSRGAGGYVDPGNPPEEERARAESALEEVRREMKRGEWDLLVLDEINVAAGIGLLEVEGILDVIRSKPEEMELVLTGRGAPQELVEEADLVTEMREVKHYYQAGVGARVGIEK